ncbi:MAG: phage tail tube protein [Xanthobacteraceae bacterium]
MPEAIKWRSKVILAKIEALYGADPVPTGAANAMLMTDVAFQPMEGEDVNRNLEFPYLGNQGTMTAAMRAVLTGSTELAGSGAAGTAPAWGPLARACALAQVIDPGVEVVYAPASDGHESVSIYFWIGDTRQVMTGVRGTGVLEIPAQGIPRIRWTFIGLWTKPSESAQATPTFTPWQQPLIATHANTPTFTIDAVPLVLRDFSLDLGNQVEPRLLIGREEIKIVDRMETIAAAVEAVPLTTFDPFDLAEQGEDGAVEVEIVHGTQAGSIVTVNAPKCQVQRLAGYENQQNVLEWPLALRPLFTAGDDQFSIVLT